MHCLTGLMVLLQLSCSASRMSGPAAGFPDACRLVEGGSAEPGVIRIASDVPKLVGRSGSSAGAGPHLLTFYSTLAVLDCEGGIHPGAALSWEKRDQGKTWVFHLKESLQEKNATSLTANEIRVAWSQIASTYPEIDRITNEGERQLIVHLSAPSAKMPAFLLAAPFLLDASSGEDTRIEIIDVADADGRDALENGSMAVITMDPDVIDYASRLSGWRNVPLPWDRTYVMVTRSDADSKESGAGEPVFPLGLARSFARDVVYVDARPYVPSASVEAVGECLVYTEFGLDGSGPPSGTLRTIRYIEGDPIAKSLAERMAAVASGAIATAGSDSLLALFPAMDAPGYVWAAKEIGMVGEMTPEADIAYLFALPRNTSNPCRSLEDFQPSLPFPFLTDRFANQPYILLPIIDVRSTLIIRGGTARVDVDGFGNLLFSMSTGSGQ